MAFDLMNWLLPERGLIKMSQDLREQAHRKRDLAAKYMGFTNQKTLAEADKLIAEADKLEKEASEMEAETAKLEDERQKSRSANPTAIIHKSVENPDAVKNLSSRSGFYDGPTYITIFGGDFDKTFRAECHTSNHSGIPGGCFRFHTSDSSGKKSLSQEIIPLSELKVVDKVNVENSASIAGAFGLGIAGGVILGPLGGVVGALLGGQGSDVTFTAKFKDSRKMLAKTDSHTYARLMAAVF